MDINRRNFLKSTTALAAVALLPSLPVPDGPRSWMLYVDVTAQSPGVGTLASPFRTIAEAMLSIKEMRDGDDITLNLAPGAYVNELISIPDGIETTFMGKGFDLIDSFISVANKRRPLFLASGSSMWGGMVEYRDPVLPSVFSPYFGPYVSPESVAD